MGCDSIFVETMSDQIQRKLTNINELKTKKEEKQKTSYNTHHRIPTLKLRTVEFDR